MAKKILSCDNEPDTVALVDKILSDAGYEVIGSLSGRECLERWKKEKPDLILLDIMMPDMSGWDVYQRIRKKDKEQKVAFLSVIDATSERVKRLREEGISDYILKPFTADELVKRVEAILKKE
jgi:DNA-binding response OmpR family regulator